VFNASEVERIWTEHQSGARDHRHRLWSLLMLELWFRQFVDSGPARAGHYEGGQRVRPNPEVAA
jgi:hypothetical protein